MECPEQLPFTVAFVGKIWVLMTTIMFLHQSRIISNSFLDYSVVIWILSTIALFELIVLWTLGSNYAICAFIGLILGIMHHDRMIPRLLRRLGIIATVP